MPVQGKDEIILKAILVGPYGSRSSTKVVYQEIFKKDAKNKTRAFYRQLYIYVTTFIE